MIVTQEPMQENKIYAMKLISGEELMAKVVALNSTDITVFKPMSVVPAGKGLGLVATFALASDENVTIRVSSVIGFYPALKEYEAAYIEASTGIHLEPQSGIIT